MNQNKRSQQANGSSRMRAYWMIGLGLSLVTLVLSVLWFPRSGPGPKLIRTPAQVQAAEETALRFRFIDEETYARVNPDGLMIDGEDFTARVQGGRMEYPAQAKSYLVSVFKEGYETMEEVFVEPTNGGYTDFILSPVDRSDPENRYGAANLGEREGRIVGYVRDSDSGEALSGATVVLSGQNREVAADSDGYFSLVYQVAALDETDPAQIELDTLRISAAGYIPQERQYVQLFSGSAQKYLINLDALDPALGGLDPFPVRIIDERLSRGGAAALSDLKTSNPPPGRAGTPEDLGPDDPSVQVAPVIDSINKMGGIRSHTIRVGLSCSCRSCSRVQVMGLEAYCRLVLPREWPASWNFNSLEAGAVAVRSYGASFIVNPISSQYDICTTTCCQAYGPPENSRTNQALRDTEGLFVVVGAVRWQDGNRPFRAEYSSENNLAPPCRRDGFTGPCLSDVVCTGTRTNGHGRGMCQFGSRRWGGGEPRSGGVKDSVWILEHYYPNNPGYQGQNVKLGHW